jgi:hypothetical protein
MRRVDYASHLRNDLLLLGLMGSLSEHELNLPRCRSIEASQE